MFWLYLFIAANIGESFVFRTFAGRSSSLWAAGTKVPHLHTAEYPGDDFAHILGINDASHQPSKLQQITAMRLKDVALSKQVVDVQGCGFDPSFFVSVEDLEKEMKDFDSKFGSPLDLKERLSATWPEMAIAAEFKKASPSKGDININADAVEQSLQYNAMGAAVISVLTEFAHFKGTLSEMKRVRLATQEACKASGRLRPAILRKDFVLDRYQIFEARAYGADTVLLIVAILGVQQLQDLIACSRALGMEPLVEVHTKREMEIALDCGARVIGVNNRNLHSFQLDLDTTARAISVAEARGLSWRPVDPLSGTRPPDVTVAALSGITSAEDVSGFRDVGVGCCLVGETLMKSADPGATITSFLKGGRLDSVGAGSDGDGFGGGAGGVRPRTLVKVCGLSRPQDASAALSAGTSLLGVIFAKSPRTATIDQARDIVQTVRKYGERSTAITFSTELAAMRASPGGQLSPRDWFSRGADLLRVTTLRRPLVVGVFQDQSAEEINAAVAATGIDLVQLHGDESPQLAERVHAPVIKVLHVPAVSGSDNTSSETDSQRERLRKQAEEWSGRALALLLDSRLPGSRGGGTGAVFDWNLASELGAPVLLAGGLSPDNVAKAAASAGVVGVDVSSGVESSPGLKDGALIGEFVRKARSS